MSQKNCSCENIHLHYETFINLKLFYLDLECLIYYSSAQEEKEENQTIFQTGARAGWGGG